MSFETTKQGQRRVASIDNEDKSQSIIAVLYSLSVNHQSDSLGTQLLHGCYIKVRGSINLEVSVLPHLLEQNMTVSVGCHHGTYGSGCVLDSYREDEMTSLNLYYGSVTVSWQENTMSTEVKEKRFLFWSEEPRTPSRLYLPHHR